MCVCFTSNLEPFNLLFTVSRTVLLNLLKGWYRKIWLKHSMNLCLHLSYLYGPLNIPLIFLMNCNLTFFCMVLGNQPRLKETISHWCFHYTKSVCYSRSTICSSMAHFPSSNPHLILCITNWKAQICAFLISQYSYVVSKNKWLVREKTTSEWISSILLLLAQLSSSSIVNSRILGRRKNAQTVCAWQT